jgi:hypothetical protein
LIAPRPALIDTDTIVVLCASLLSSTVGLAVSVLK